MSIISTKIIPSKLPPLAPMQITDGDANFFFSPPPHRFQQGRNPNGNVHPAQAVHSPAQNQQAPGQYANRSSAQGISAQQAPGNNGGPSRKPSSQGGNGPYQPTPALSHHDTHGLAGGMRSVAGGSVSASFHVPQPANILSQGVRHPNILHQAEAANILGIQAIANGTEVPRHYERFAPHAAHHAQQPHANGQLRNPGLNPLRDTSRLFDHHLTHISTLRPSPRLMQSNGSSAGVGPTTTNGNPMVTSHPTQSLNRAGGQMPNSQGPYDSQRNDGIRRRPVDQNGNESTAPTPPKFGPGTKEAISRNNIPSNHYPSDQMRMNGQSQSRNGTGMDPRSAAPLRNSQGTYINSQSSERVGSSQHGVTHGQFSNPMGNLIAQNRQQISGRGVPENGGLNHGGPIFNPAISRQNMHLNPDRAMQSVEEVPENYRLDNSQNFTSGSDANRPINHPSAHPGMGNGNIMTSGTGPRGGYSAQPSFVPNVSHIHHNQPPARPSATPRSNSYIQSHSVQPGMHSNASQHIMASGNGSSGRYNVQPSSVQQVPQAPRNQQPAQQSATGSNPYFHGNPQETGRPQNMYSGNRPGGSYIAQPSTVFNGQQPANNTPLSRNNSGSSSNGYRTGQASTPLNMIPPNPIQTPAVGNNNLRNSAQVPTAALTNLRELPQGNRPSQNRNPNQQLHQSQILDSHFNSASFPSGQLPQFPARNSNSLTPAQRHGFIPGHGASSQHPLINNSGPWPKIHQSLTANPSLPVDNLQPRQQVQQPFAQPIYQNRRESGNRPDIPSLRQEAMRRSASQISISRPSPTLSVPGEFQNPQTNLHGSPSLEIAGHNGGVQRQANANSSSPITRPMYRPMAMQRSAPNGQQHIQTERHGFSEMGPQETNLSNGQYPMTGPSNGHIKPYPQAPSISPDAGQAGQSSSSQSQPQPQYAPSDQLEVPEEISLPTFDEQMILWLTSNSVDGFKKILESVIALENDGWGSKERADTARKWLFAVETGAPLPINGEGNGEISNRGETPRKRRSPSSQDVEPGAKRQQISQGQNQPVIDLENDDERNRYINPPTPAINPMLTTEISPGRQTNPGPSKKRALGSVADIAERYAKRQHVADPRRPIGSYPTPAESDQGTPMNPGISNQPISICTNMTPQSSNQGKQVHSRQTPKPGNPGARASLTPRGSVVGIQGVSSSSNISQPAISNTEAPRLDDQIKSANQHRPSNQAHSKPEETSGMAASSSMIAEKHKFSVQNGSASKPADMDNGGLQKVNSSVRRAETRVDAELDALLLESFEETCRKERELEDETPNPNNNIVMEIMAEIAAAEAARSGDIQDIGAQPTFNTSPTQPSIPGMDHTLVDPPWWEDFARDYGLQI